MANYHASKGEGGTTASSGDRPPNIREYSYEAFVDAITEFIIANDQVCISSSCYDCYDSLNSCQNYSL